MTEQSDRRGRIRPAPENFLTPAQIAEVRAGRRDFLRNAFLAAAGASAAPAVLAAAAGNGDPAILDKQPWGTTLGKPVASDPYGLPSKYEKNLIRRESPGLASVGGASVAFTPLQGLFGIITPSGLHFERHHQGWQDIDPAQHRLMINGLVKTPKVYTMEDLLRFPSVSRIHFLECGANSAMEWANTAVPTVQYTHGMLSCSEWTGVPLKVLLEDCGIDLKKAKYVYAEGADGSHQNRTIPLEWCLDDVIVAYGQNGEMLRPQQGYPLRLVVPGAQGVSWIKYLRRIEVGDQVWNTKDETLHYADLMPGGTTRQYTPVQEVKSVITSPSGGQVMLDRGLHTISGLAWSGRGKIERVDVSTDGGRNWQTASLGSLVLDKALTRFQLPWQWDGKPALLQSRAIDETGHVQPQMRALREVRGTRMVYHNNAIQTWKVTETGEVFNVQIA